MSTCTLTESLPGKTENSVTIHHPWDRDERGRKSFITKESRMASQRGTGFLFLDQLKRGGIIIQRIIKSERPKFKR